MFQRNHNASKFDTKTINEDITKDRRRFSKRNGKLCNVAKSVASETEELPSNTYQTHHYNPQPVQRTSRILNRYYV